MLDKRIAVLCEPYERQIAQLDGIPGFGVRTAQDLIGEIGVDMAAFPTAGHLCSWARLAPRVRESAGGRGRTPPAAATLTSAAPSARPPPEPGAPRPSSAPVRRLHPHAEEESPGRHHQDQLVITHVLLSDPGAGYRDLGTGYYEQRDRTRRRASSHVRSLERLGYKVTIEPLTPDADPETGELITRTAS